GLVGLFSAILTLANSVAGMGVKQSGVRQIAEATGSAETERIARTAAVLQRTSMVLGILGAVALVVFRRTVSIWTFGTDAYSGSVALLSVGVLVWQISDGQAALIQGMRRISDLARISVLGAVGGSVLSLVLVYFLRDKGVVPSLVGAAVATLIVSWRYRRTVDIPRVSLTIDQIREEAGALLTLGSAFMASAALTTAAAYVVRIIVRDRIGLEAAGLYQAAWALGG